MGAIEDWKNIVDVYLPLPAVAELVEPLEIMTSEGAHNNVARDWSR